MTPLEIVRPMPLEEAVKELEKLGLAEPNEEESPTRPCPISLRPLTRETTAGCEAHRIAAVASISIAVHLASTKPYRMHVAS